MSGWDQRGDIDDLLRRLRHERRVHRLTASIFFFGAGANITLGVIRHDWLQFTIGIFLLVVFFVR